MKDVNAPAPRASSPHPARRPPQRHPARLWLGAGLALALGAGAATWLALPPPLARVSEPETPAPTALVEQGRYIARAGDCVACHTAPGGAELAGGLALQTPFGTLWSTNITPDAQHGLGTWSYAAFERAMRRGVAADGHRLYPAMPYPSYAKMSDEDMQALWAYLKQGVAPVGQANRPTEMHFPFNQRWGLAYWDAAFVESTPFRPDPARDAVWNRGAYLVQGLGHCGACHTPRGVGFQELAMSEAGPNGRRFLAGAQVEHWSAVALRELWTVPDTVELLKTGRNRFATASGNMTDVILHSTQHLSEPDLTAIASYLKSLPAERPALVAARAPAAAAAPEPATAATTGAPPPAAPATLYSTRGGLGYAQFCTDCHRLDGSGVAGIFPALAGNPSVATRDPATLIHLMLTGWKTAATDRYPRSYTMPGFARLQDEEIAEILSFVRQSWGQGAGPVRAAEVAAARQSLGPKVDQSRFETPRLARLLAEPNAAQLVRGMRLNAETRTLLPGHVGNQLNCSSCHLNAGTVAEGSPYVGVSAFFPSYAPRAGKVISLEERINGCFRRSMNGKPLAPDSADMQAMVAYFNWMKGATRPEDKVAGRGVGKINPALVPDPAHGREVYAAQCAACHGADGEGLQDAAGRTIYPPLWGAQSFNLGAGMARSYTAAAFVQRNMPIGRHDKFPLGQGGLSDQDALDVADYFSHLERPDFPDKVKDWPRDPKPRDARY